MKNRIKLALTAFCFGLCVLTPALVVTAQEDEKYWGGDALGGNTSDVTKDSVKEATGLDATADPRIIAARVINIILGFLGIIMVCLILYAGFIWMMSEGNAAKITQAKGIMISAAIGLAVVLSSYAIAEMVIREFVDASSGDATSSLIPDKA